MDFSPGAAGTLSRPRSHGHGRRPPWKYSAPAHGGLRAHPGSTPRTPRPRPSRTLRAPWSASCCSPGHGDDPYGIAMVHGQLGQEMSYGLSPRSTRGASPFRNGSAPTRGLRRGVTCTKKSSRRCFPTGSGDAACTVHLVRGLLACNSTPIGTPDGRTPSPAKGEGDRTSPPMAPPMSPPGAREVLGGRPPSPRISTPTSAKPWLAPTPRQLGADLPPRGSPYAARHRGCTCSFLPISTPTRTSSSRRWRPPTPRPPGGLKFSRPGFPNSTSTLALTWCHPPGRSPGAPGNLLVVDIEANKSPRRRGGRCCSSIAVHLRPTARALGAGASPEEPFANGSMVANHVVPGRHPDVGTLHTEGSP